MVIHFYRTDYLSAARFHCDCRFLTPNEFSFSSFTDICYKVKTVFKKDVVFLTIQPKPVALFVGRGVHNPDWLALRFSRFTSGCFTTTSPPTSSPSFSEHTHTANKHQINYYYRLGFCVMSSV